MLRSQSYIHDESARSGGFFMRGGIMIATVQVSERTSAQGPLVWRRGERAAVDTGGGRIVEGRIIDPRRRDESNTKDLARPDNP